MIKNSVSSGIHTLCNRCSRILATDFNYLTGTPAWEIIEMPWKGNQVKTRRFDFCDEKCRIIYFRGRKYYQRKLKYIVDHDRRMDGN